MSYRRGRLCEPGEGPCDVQRPSFWSRKWNGAQQNYPAHEQELLALVETLNRFRGILHGTKFTVRTVHRALIHFMKQKDLSVRRHRLLDVSSAFDFEVEYILPGETNGFADALSRIYSGEKPGIIRAESGLIDGKDEMKTYWLPKVPTVYVEVRFLSLVNAEARRSARLSSKPTTQYKEIRIVNLRELATNPRVPLQAVISRACEALYYPGLQKT